MRSRADDNNNNYDNNSNKNSNNNNNNNHHYNHNDPSSSPEDLFSECVTGLLMETEELRRSLDDVFNSSNSTSSRNNSSSNSSKSSRSSNNNKKSVVQMHHVVHWLHALERLLPLLDQLARLTDDGCGHRNNNNNNSNNNNNTNVHVDLFQHCQDKVLAIAQHVLESSFRWHEPTEEDDNNDNNDYDNFVEDRPDETIPLDVVRQDGQAAIARLTELNLILFAAAAPPPEEDEATVTSRQNTTMASIIQSYVAYQRKVLRLRAKPAIARLVQARQTENAMTSLLLSTATPGNNNNLNENDEDDDDEGDNAASDRAPMVPQHHAPVLAVILGQAAALIHPLLVWQANVPAVVVDPNTEKEEELDHGTNVVRGAIRQLCTESVNILDEQAQTLTKTVCDWFAEDRPIDKWMQTSATAAAAATDQEYSLEKDSMDRNQLRLLDALVEEMAFLCQLLARYQALLQAHHDNSGGPTQSVIANELLPEWTWKYATLERFLALQQWQSARSLASPVHTVIGTDIQVPSVVEDALYLSTRALERAASTQSQHAIGTVAHSVSRDIWSTEVTGGVYQALVEKRGCWVEPKQAAADASAKTAPKMSLSSSTPPRSGFASALLDALDEDLQSARHAPPPPPSASSSLSSSLRNGGAPTPRHSGPPSAPSSGNFLTALVSGVGGTANDKLQQMQMETDFCVLNGIHASSGACRSLVALLDSLLLLEDEGPEQSPSEKQTGQTVAMIQLAREELFQYAESYHTLLQARIQEALETWCGAGPEDLSGLQQALAFHNLRQFLVRETYHLDADSFATAESDERLEREYMNFFYDCRFLKEMADRCEADVLRQVGEQSVAALVSLFLDALWNTDKRFTDWGSLLLSKQIRLMQTFLSECLTSKWADVRTPNLLHGWERLSHVLTILQLEKPSDWLMYNFDPSALPLNELQRTMCLRVDFSVDAVQAVVTQVSAKLTTAHAKTSTTA